MKYGASPRAAIGLAEAVRVRALMYGKPSVGAEDIRAFTTCVGAQDCPRLSCKTRWCICSTLIDDVLKQENL